MKRPRNTAGRFGLRKAVSVLAATAALIAAPLVAFIPAANAAVAETGVTGVTLSGASNLKVGNQVTVNATWEAKPGAVAGDTFELALPGEFTGQSSTFPLINGTGGSSIGSCTVQATKIVCTLNSTVNGLSNVGGTLSFAAAANKTRAAGDVSWTSSTGDVFATNLPQGITAASATVDTNKSGYMSADKYMRWQIKVAPQQIVDGKITIVDTMGDGLGFVANSMTVSRQPVAGYSDSGTFTPVTGWEKTGTNPFTVTVPDADPNYVYMIRYNTQPPAGTQNGDILHNSANIASNTYSGSKAWQVAGGSGSGNLTAVAPVNPTVKQAVCESGIQTKPSVDLPTTAGLTYAITGTVSAGETVTVTANALYGYTISATSGWTVSADGNSATRQIVLDNPSCVQEIAPVAPSVTQAVCNADGTATDPEVTTATTDGVEYKLDGEIKAGSKVTVTATAAEGHVLTAAEGWTLAEDAKTATFEVTLDAVECEKPLVEVAPVAPSVTQAVCNADGTAADPEVTTATTDGVEYKLDGEIKAGSKVTVTATAAEGHVLTAAEGWTLAEDAKTATFEVTLDAVECEKPLVEVAPVAPSVTQAVCNADGTAADPEVTTATTDGVEYKLDGEIKAGSKVTVTATASEGHVLTAAEGWTLAEDAKTATFEVTLDAVECEKPLVEVAPVAPSVTQAVCNADGTAADPEVTTATTDGVEYKLDGEIKAGSKVTVTATASEGHVLTAAEGWTLAEDAKTATFEVTLDAVECEKPLVEVAPVAPSVTQAVCNADGTAADPEVTTATTDGVEYKLDGEIKAGSKVTVTATAAEGHVLTAAEGWTLAEDAKTATFEVTLDAVECEKPLVEVAPVAPSVTQAVCNADGTATDPEVTTATTDGVEYKLDGEIKAGSKVTVTATAAEGHVLTAAEGWTLAEDAKTATFEVTLDAVECEKPLVEVAPVAPSVTQAVCNADGTAADPEVTTATTDGVEYKLDGEIKAGSKVTVTATAAEGHVLTAAEGWTLAEDAKTATFEVILEDAVDCAVPEPTKPTDSPEPTKPTDSPEPTKPTDSPEPTKPTDSPEPGESTSESTSGTDGGELAHTGASSSLLLLALAGAALVIGGGAITAKRLRGKRS